MIRWMVKNEGRENRWSLTKGAVSGIGPWALLVARQHSCPKTSSTRWLMKTAVGMQFDSMNKNIIPSSCWP